MQNKKDDKAGSSFFLSCSLEVGSYTYPKNEKWEFGVFMKKLFVFILVSAMAFCLVACTGAEDEARNNSNANLVPEIESYSWQAVSIAPEDYGILYDDDTVLMGWEAYPLDKLCAYYLGADGAYAEGSGDELYKRFMAAPNTVLNYLALIGEQTVLISNDGSTALAQNLLCREIATEDVAYSTTEEFEKIISKYQKIYTNGTVADVLACLQKEHDAFIK